VEPVVPLVGMGCMRLSTELDRDYARAVDVLHAALDAGINFLDTADAYCWDATEVGHNERLIAHALRTWRGDASQIIVATKGGLTRHGGRWISDGRARHLTAACDASRRALGLERLPLYQLHVVDPRTPLTTSVRALASLKRAELIDGIGLCNVTVGQIEQARAITEIAAVQVELSFWRDADLLGGVVQYCVENGIRLVAYRPLGGIKRGRRVQSDPVLAEIASRHDATPFEIALAWLSDLSPLIVSVPGPTRIETARSVGRAHQIVLTEDDRARLDERLPAARRLREGQTGQRGQVGLVGRVGQIGRVGETGEEIVLIIGLPAAGKTTLAQSEAFRGYERLNRDDAGGRLGDLLPSLDRLIGSGSRRIVLDNTYGSRASRAAVIEVGRKHGLPVRCVWLSTPVEDAQMNAVLRGTPAFAPTAQFRHQRAFEEPNESEGFWRIDVVPFERRRDPMFSNRALILWCDGVLRRSRSGQPRPVSPDDVELLPGRAGVLHRHAAEGWRLLGMSWQPEIAEKAVSVAEVDAGFARMQELLGVPIEVEYCPHGGGPPVCWCRKPLPELGVRFIQRHRLDAAQCIYVGGGPQDPGFAGRFGFQYRDAEEFFEPGK
jgi:aryl-alcohol dehydrogenase-like predicted oxidoreductase/predicted kinase/histidinol phosphatase-like enzyme